jgi:hypothetical protein
MDRRTFVMSSAGAAAVALFRPAGAAQRANEKIVIALSALLALGSVFALTRPAVGADSLATATPGHDAYTPAVAFGENSYLIVWQSGQIAAGDLREGFRCIGDIVACRVDKAGKLVSTEPLVVCGADDLQAKPQLAFGGGGFLVVWQDLRNGKDWDVYAARVSPEGEVLDPDGFLVSGGKHNQAKPRVVWDGKTFLVVWQDFRSGRRYEVRSARVSPDGEVVDADGVQVASGEF